ncbi:MAG TPA: helicase associated domain-containing protein [Acidimicrobiales bacterium]|nr:helicase associated domain-containing protein [Acidimicrobiales bacterium]
MTEPTRTRRVDGRETRIRGRAAQWRRRFDELTSFVEQTGHQPRWTAPLGSLERQLYTWLTAQRVALAEGRLRSDRHELLVAVGALGNGIRGSRWRRNVDALLAFHREKGRLPRPRSFDAREDRLWRFFEQARHDPRFAGIAAEFGDTIRSAAEAV